MTRAEFNRLFNEYFKPTTTAFMMAQTPVRSGRMMREAKVYDTDKGFGIEWGTPYTVYTVERWISPRWRGRKNPRERWILNAVEARLDLLTAQFGGRYYER